MAFWVTSGDFWRGDWISQFRRREYRGEGEGQLGAPVPVPRDKVKPRVGQHSGFGFGAFENEFGDEEEEEVKTQITFGEILCCFHLCIL